MSASESLPMTQLQVNRTELLEGLKQLARLTKPATAGDAILRFEDGHLVIRVGGGEVAAGATGRWPGEACVAGAFVLAMAKHPPGSDPVLIRVDAGRLYLAGTSMPCAWQESGAAQVEIPIGASLAEILRIGMAHTDEVLGKSGIWTRVEEARAQRDRLLQKAAELLERAAEVLEPLGVTREDFDALIEDRIRSRHVPSTGDDR